MASTLALIIVKNKLLVIPMLIGFLCMLFGGSYIIHADDRRWSIRNVTKIDRGNT